MRGNALTNWQPSTGMCCWRLREIITNCLCRWRAVSQATAQGKLFDGYGLTWQIIYGASKKSTIRHPVADRAVISNCCPGTAHEKAG